MLTSNGGHPSVLRTLAFAWYFPTWHGAGLQALSLRERQNGVLTRNSTVFCATRPLCCPCAPVSCSHVCGGVPRFCVPRSSQLADDRECCRCCNPRRLPRAVKLGREGLVAQQPAQSWDSVSSSGIPVLNCSGNDACSELWVIVEYCDRGTLGVRLAPLVCAACEGEAAWVQCPGAGRMDLS